MASPRTKVEQAPVPPPAKRKRKALTIGAVAKLLSKEFDDVSISKIRYLEDQKLVTPRRTPGGYRLYGQADVERLRTVLRLQRDEFLPLRVIRQELSAGAEATEVRSKSRKGAARRARLITEPASRVSLEDLLEETGASEEFLMELADFGLIRPRNDSGTTVFEEVDIEIVRAALELSRAGIAARNLRLFRTSADREAQLIEALLAPRLVSKNPQRRKEGIQSLERMATVMSELQHALLVRDLRRLSDS